MSVRFASDARDRDTHDGKFTLEFTDKERRLAGNMAWKRRPGQYEERYAPHCGIETDRGLKNRLDLGRLRVRGRGSVFRVLRHKVAGWNVLRAAASAKLRIDVDPSGPDPQRERIWAD